MRLPKNLLSSGTYVKPRIFLCETNKERICELQTSNTNGSFKFNSYSELSFEVGRVYNDMMTGGIMINPYYDKIEALRLIELEDFGFFELQGPELIGDGIKEVKSCNCYSLEYTLSQKYLSNFLINTGTIGSVEVTYAEDVMGNIDNIIPVTLYNPSNKELSLLHLVLNKVYGWSIGHVDDSLKTLSRSFEIDRESVYDFLMNEVCEKFNCYIIFDTINNTINLYAESLTSKFIADGVTNRFTISPPFAQISTVSVDGYKTTRWEYNSSTGQLTLGDIPITGAHIEVIDGALTKWETDVFITFDNLSQEVKVSYDADSIKTVLTVSYGDDNDIREVNLGLPYITDLSYFYNVDWMGQDLYDAYTTYLQKANKHQDTYTNNSQEMLEISSHIWFEEGRQSLQYAVVDSVAPDTVGTYYVRHGDLPNYYYTEVSLPSEYKVGTEYYKMDGVNLTEDSATNLYYAIEKCYLGNGVDKIKALYEDVNTFSFMDDTYPISRLADNLSKLDSMSAKDVEVNQFLDIMWEQVGRTPLKTQYLECFNQIKIALIDGGYSQKNNSSYPSYYLITVFIDSIEHAIKKRDIKISNYEEQYNTLVRSNVSISNELLMDNNFTEDQLIRLSAFLREDELQLDDIVETSQDSVADSFKVKQDAMESGRIELQKLCQPQLQFSMSMANIYALSEFEPIIDQFQLGKVIKVGLRPDYIKQSRLLRVDINFEDFSDFSCEFGELTSLRSQSDIHADLLSQAISAGKSVATHSSYWTRGSEQSGEIQQKINAGLLDAVTSIKSIDATQGVEIDKYGIHLKTINPRTGEAELEQGWITNNKFLYTDDGFKSTKSVFGKYTYDNQTYYGILAEALVGSLIVGTNIEIGNANGTLKFNDEGFSVTNGSTTFQVNPDSDQLINLSNDTENLFYVDDDGKLHIAGDGKDLDISANTSVSEIKQTTEEIRLSVQDETQRAIKTETELSTRINNAETSITQTNKDIELRATQEDFEEYKDYVTDNYYTKEQTNEAVLDISSEAIEARVSEVKSYVDNNYSTTSEMNAAINLKAGEITSTVNQSIANIQVGGRNILQRTNVSKYSSKWTSWKSSLSVNANDYLKITPSASTTSAGAYPPNLSTLEANTEYTLSFDAFADASITLNYLYIMSTEGNASLNASIAISNVSNKYTYTFTTTKSYSNSSIMIGYSNSSGISTPFYIKNLKLEKGNKATDWTPAPEDDETEIKNLSSQITQTAKEIRSEVSETYATNDTLKDYSTTEQMNSAISQSASEITSTVANTYATIGQTKHYGTCSTPASTVAKVVTCSGFSLYTGATISVRFTHSNSAASPTLNVNSTGAKSIRAYNNVLTATSGYNWSAQSVVTFVYDGTYWRLSDSGALYQTTNLSSRITQTAESIEAEVTRAQGAEADLNSRITINANAITSKVNSGDFGTLIEQNYNHVKIAWNKNSNYIQFEDGAMNIYTSSTRNTNTLLMKQNHQGAWYYRDGTTIGKIGTNNWINDTSYRGLVFDLEHDASYMCWAAKDSSSATAYNVKLIYHHKDSKDKEGLHFSCNTYADSNLYLTDNYRFVAYNNSTSVGYNGPMQWTDGSNNVYVKIDGTSKTFEIFNNVSIGIYSDIDMHNFDILNQSDARLKTNIQNTQIDALSTINQIEMKEFDWIESGEHEDIGIIAQQLQTILPDLVSEDSSTGKLSIKINKFIPYLIKSIQELTDYITGGVSTFSLDRDWVDPYSVEEKAAFVTTNSCYDKNETLEVLESPKILIPIETQGEEDNESQ